MTVIEQGIVNQQLATLDWAVEIAERCETIGELIIELRDKQMKIIKGEL